jgi:hypothetical protein
MTVGVAETLSEITSVPLRELGGTGIAGLKVTLSVQYAPAAIVPTQLFFTAKSVDPATDAEFTLSTAGAAPVFDTVTMAGALATPAS